ncbi:hypothetical protein [Spirochaeta isovalerica]|uniref:Uncharacterized protein n=1 Tax=Spirochaeta isovalerica TaxID=150 RepID=A0A841RAC7_9SPIO|nr:hypothetical protein [Spirochaeta isovalerica]MBB6480321.1 hypothetical protein [Spirochaeta isovalerica]
MVDYTAGGGEEKKKSGCLTVLIIIVAILAGLGTAVYFLLPSIIAGAVSGGFASGILPDEVLMQLETINVQIDENIGQLEQYGLDNDEIRTLVESIDYGTVESVLDELEGMENVTTSDLIDLMDRRVDLSAVDLERVKKDFNSQIPEENLNRLLEQARENPLFAKAAFNIFKETLLKSLESEDTIIPEPEMEPEPEQSGGSSSGSSTTKKKK